MLHLHRSCVCTGAASASAKVLRLHRICICVCKGTASAQELCLHLHRCCVCIGAAFVFAQELRLCLHRCCICTGAASALVLRLHRCCVCIGAPSASAQERICTYLRHTEDEGLCYRDNLCKNQTQSVGGALLSRLYSNFTKSCFSMITPPPPQTLDSVVSYPLNPSLVLITESSGALGGAVCSGQGC